MKKQNDIKRSEKTNKAVPPLACEYGRRGAIAVRELHTLKKKLTTSRSLPRRSSALQQRLENSTAVDPEARMTSCVLVAVWPLST